MHLKADDIVRTAKEFIDVPFRHQGRNEMGLDCAGLIIVVARLNGITSFDTASYSRRPNATEFTQGLIDAGCKQLPYGEQVHGDILRFNTGGQPVHMGIYEVDEAGREWCIHAFLPHKKVTRDLLVKPRTDLINSVWRFPE